MNDAIARVHQHATAAVAMAVAVGDAIRELGSIPSGHLYARLMGHLSLEEYNEIISTLARTGLVRREGSHLLVWAGPHGPASEPNQNQQPTPIDMTTVQIASNATSKSIQAAHKPPQGSTHFRFTTPDRKPVIDKLANLDTLAGCSGKLEYGKVEFEGRGRYAKIKAFTPLAAEAKGRAKKAVVPEPTEAAPTQPESAPVAATPDAKQPASKARKNKVFGHSACAVAKALGKAGVKYEEADRIFRAQGIEMPKASLSVQLGFGRNEAAWERHGKPAELTDAQIAELRAGVAA